MEFNKSVVRVYDDVVNRRNGQVISRRSRRIDASGKTGNQCVEEAGISSDDVIGLIGDKFISFHGSVVERHQSVDQMVIPNSIYSDDGIGSGYVADNESGIVAGG